MRSIAVTVLDLIGIKNSVSRLLASWGYWRPLVPEEKFLESCRSAVRILAQEGGDATLGDYVEFGVSRGTSLSCMYRVLAEQDLQQPRLIGFDSFEGMPSEAAQEGWAPGQYKSTLKETRGYLARRGVDLGRVTLVPGWFADTLTTATAQELKLTKAGLIMVDCDIYSASRDALAFCRPLVHDRAVIIFDDWGGAVGKGKAGQKEAFEEFLAISPDLRATPLNSYRPESRVFLLTRAMSAAAASHLDETSSVRERPGR